MPLERRNLVYRSLTVLVAGEDGRIDCMREIVSAEFAPERPDTGRDLEIQCLSGVPYPAVGHKRSL